MLVWMLKIQESNPVSWWVGLASCQEAVTEVEMQAVGERERKGWKDLSDILELLLCDISAGWLGGGAGHGI